MSNTNFIIKVKDIIQDKDFQNEVAQIQAKSLLSEVADKIPNYNWTYISRRVVRNITFATIQLIKFAKDEPENINSLTKEAKKVALVWEALARLSESTTTETALINAALNYELAGYQANALCIAKQLVPREVNIN